MGRVSTRSNPTGLIEIDKRKVGILVSTIETRRYFSLARLDVAGLSLDPNNQVICIARAGKTSQRFDMGTVAAFRKDNLPLDELDLSELLKFRILIHPASESKLLASAENLRPLNETESESLLPMEPTDLGQLLWRVDIDDEGPVLKFNSSIFPSAAGVENYLPFAALVLPEAVRRVMEHIADEPDSLTDDSDPFNLWGPWLDALGLDRPMNDADDKEKRDWCNRVVEAFCNRYSFGSRLGQQLEVGGNG